jgi:serine/threonine protein kinase
VCEQPENLLLEHPGDDANVKLCDFGFACKVDTPDGLDLPCGTPGCVGGNQ